MSTPDLTTEKGVVEYLSGKGYDGAELKRLAVGFSAFVYRAQLHNPSRAIIVKHVEGFAARAPAWKLDPGRLIFEANALRLLSSTPFQIDAPVRVPRLLDHDDVSNVVLLEDVGGWPTLKQWLQSSSPLPTVKLIGNALGRFLATVHNVTAGDAAIKAEFATNKTAMALSSALFFGNLPKNAEQRGYTDAFIREAAVVAKEEVLTSRDVLTLGDFWAGNVLVSEQQSTDDEEPTVQLYALDFELAKPGTAVFDIGQMAAEMYFLALFRDLDAGTALLDAFLHSYKAESQAKVDVDKLAVRVGAHFIAIAPNAWGAQVGEEAIENVVKLGVEMIRIGHERDEEALGRSILRSLLE